MIPIAKLRDNFAFNENLGAIIEAFKMGASIQLRRYQSLWGLCEEFNESLDEISKTLSGVDLNHYLLNSKENSGRCLIAVTTDDGFVGELNNLVIQTVIDKVKDRSKDVVIVLGTRGASYLYEAGIKPVVFSGITDGVDTTHAGTLKKYILNEYRRRKFSQVEIVYPHFKSVVIRHIKSFKLLPFSLGEPTHAPVDNHYLETLLEPNASLVVEALVGLWLEFNLLKIFRLSKLSEFSTRFMHLDSSEQELRKINSSLRLDYFRFMHALADRRIREVSAERFLRKT